MVGIQHMRRCRAFIIGMLLHRPPKRQKRRTTNACKMRKEQAESSFSHVRNGHQLKLETKTTTKRQLKLETTTKRLSLLLHPLPTHLGSVGQGMFQHLVGSRFQIAVDILLLVPLVSNGLHEETGHGAGGDKQKIPPTSKTYSNATERVARCRPSVAPQSRKFHSIM